jgi:DNA polymerase (family 10)
MARGLVLNEYGLFTREPEQLVAADREAAIYAALELPFIPPPMREDSGELDGELPAFLELGALHGDLHVHTDMSGDGESTLEEMLSHAVRRGYRFMAITDHAENLPMIGVGREAMMAQRDKIASVRSAYPGLNVLHGCELNIGPEGDLDYDAEVRAGFDWCVAAVHSHFDLTPFEQTKRLSTAMRDGSVNVIGHLSGRRIGRRPGVEFDVDAVLEAAALTGTAIKINSALGRLDASADVLRRARSRDVYFTISTDAHHIDEYARLQWGAAQAQRGWVDPDRVVTSWAPERFLAWAKARRRGPG